MMLPEDHTYGTSPGRPTPTACVASNDLALGRIVDRTPMRELNEIVWKSVRGASSKMPAPKSRFVEGR